MQGESLSSPGSRMLVVCGRSSAVSSPYILEPLSCALYAVKLHTHSLRLTVLIIYICVDVKPISVIGLAHQLQLENISKGFQNVPTEHAPPEKLMSFISNYLVDVSFLEDTCAQDPAHPTFPPPLPPAVPLVAGNVRDAEAILRVPLAAHNIPGYHVELLELQTRRKEKLYEGEA